MSTKPIEPSSDFDSAYRTWLWLQRSLNDEILYRRANLRYRDPNTSHSATVNQTLAWARQLIVDIEAGLYEPPIDNQVKALLDEAEAVNRKAQALARDKRSQVITNSYADTEAIARIQAKYAEAK